MASCFHFEGGTLGPGCVGKGGWKAVWAIGIFCLGGFGFFFSLKIIGKCSAAVLLPPRTIWDWWDDSSMHVAAKQGHSCPEEDQIQMGNWGLGMHYTVPHLKKLIFSNTPGCFCSLNVEMRILLGLRLPCAWAKIVMPAVENILTADGKLMFILQLWHFWGAVGNVLMSLSKQDYKESSNNCAAERNWAAAAR